MNIYTKKKFREKYEFSGNLNDSYENIGYFFSQGKYLLRLRCRNIVSYNIINRLCNKLWDNTLERDTIYYNFMIV